MKNLFLCLLLLVCTNLYSQDFFYYRYNTVDRGDELANEFLLADSLFTPIKGKREQALIRNLWKNSVGIFKYPTIFQQLYWRYNSEVHYDKSEKSLTDKRQIYFDSLKICNYQLYLQIRDCKEIRVTDPEMKRVESQRDYAKFLIRDGKLYIKFKNFFVKVFDSNQLDLRVVSFYGKSEMLNHYTTIRFFNREFKDIYEFYFVPFRGSDAGEMLLWFDKEFKLIRMETYFHGYLLNKQ